MSDARKEKKDRNITPVLTLRLRRRLKVSRLGPARGSRNVAPAYTVNDSISGDVFVDVDIILVRNRRAVSVSWVIRSGVWRVRAAGRRGGDRRVTRGSRRSAGSSGGGVGRGARDWATAERATVGIMARCPASARGALINRTLVPVVA